VSDLSITQSRRKRQRNSSLVANADPAPLAAIYTRVSTEEQVKGFSLPTQIEACQKLAVSHGYTVPEHHVLTDDGISGTTLDRPGLRQLRELVNARAIAAAIVIDIDRLSRNLGHQLLLAEEFERADVKLLIVSHPMEQGPEGWLFFQMRGALAEYERAKILERTSRGRRGRVQAGFALLGSGVPLGYEYLRGSADRTVRGSLVINTAEAALVQQIFDLYLSGYGIWAIARRLTAERIPTKGDRVLRARQEAARGRGEEPAAVPRPNRKTAPQGVWRPATVRKILRNEVYTGV
jgi:site-specific DNA recombinase